MNRMDWETKEIQPENLPFYAGWPKELYGEIIYAEVSCPGVCYLTTSVTAAYPYCREYYAVQDGADAISNEARTYGTAVPDCPGVLFFEHALANGGREIIEYEVEKYRLTHGCSPKENFTLHGAAIYGMELYPQYFGTFPVPFVTPMGYTCRYKRIDNGIYWIETDQCKTCLAVRFPYCDEFSPAAESLAVQTEEDRAKGQNHTLGYLFFAQETCCIPIFELMRTREWEKIIDRAALMNAIWKSFPEYATVHNMDEQSGRHDMLGMMLIGLGQQDVELHGSVERVISMTPGTGTEFFRFLQP